MPLFLALLLAGALAAPTPTAPSFPVWPTGTPAPGERPGTIGNETSH